MHIGLLKEIKTKEFRVALTPSGAQELIRSGHEVNVQSGAGEGSGFSDSEYREAGATLLENPEEIFDKASLIIKVKEPLPQEYACFKPHHTLFTYLHLASNEPLTRALMDSGITAIAYESVIENNRTVLLEPMSEIAGKLAPLVGSYFQEKHKGGEGILISGLSGIPAAKVLILGAGMAGYSAAQMAAGMGAQVKIMDINPDRLKMVDDTLPANVVTEYSSTSAITKNLTEADIVIGAVYLRNARTPHIVSKEMLSFMKQGAVMVDISIDQGGCFESSKATTHDDPVFIEKGIVHYCVANMPGAYPRTSTLALTHRTLPYIQQLAEGKISPALESGINVKKGKLLAEEVREAHKL